MADNTTTGSQDLHIGKDEFKSVDVRARSAGKSDPNASIIDKINEWLIDHGKVKIKEQVTFFRLLATMINAGVSLVKSLTILEEQSKNPKLKKVCAHLRATVEMGQHLSDGMHKYPDIFASAQIGMLHSGEVSGKLNQVLLEIAGQLESSAKIKGKIKGAMMYPIAIVVVLIVVVIAVSVLVMPKLKTTFEAAGADLPGSTQMLIAFSDFFTGSLWIIPNWVLFLGGLIGLYNLLGMWKRTENGKYYWNIFIFRMPVFGQLSRKVVLSKFCRSIATLLRSGLGITRALNITSEVVGSEVYRRRINLIAQDVTQGITIGENIKGQEKMWPIMLVSMIGVGEQTAQLDGVSEKLAEFYEDEVDNVVKNLSALMEPIIILLIGGVVGFIVSAIMTPIMNLSQVVAG